MSDLPPPAAERRAAGHARRAIMPRSAHADWVAPTGRADPVATLVACDMGRIAALLPLRYGRMAVDAFAFLRGAGSVMAADLGANPTTGLRTQLAGDAHLANFGAISGVTGEALFDINDFDETLPGPFEWDLKRLAASLAVNGRVQSLSEKACRALAETAVHAYRREIDTLSELAPIDVWRRHVKLEHAIDTIDDRDLRRQERRRLAAIVQSGRDGFRSLVANDGTLRLPERPPAIFRLGDQDQTAHAAFEAYILGLPEEIRVLVQRYRLRDVAFKAVGVGSVGTFCAIGLFATADGDTLLLQLKQASISVLSGVAGPSLYAQQGKRVVVGQRMLQAQPDLFLGWTQSDGRDFYVRRLKDPRLAAVGTRTEAASLPFYARLCGRTLARAHARAGDAAVIAGYLGDGDSFDRAVSRWALAYAKQTERDWKRFVAAIAAGEIPARMEARP